MKALYLVVFTQFRTQSRTILLLELLYAADQDGQDGKG
jgi:hypothetical protein